MESYIRKGSEGVKRALITTLLMGALENYDLVSRASNSNAASANGIAIFLERAPILDTFSTL